MWTRDHKIGVVVLLWVCFSGCNLLSSFDSPKTSGQFFSDAIAYGDLNNCATAKDFLLKSTQTDSTYNALGWAYLCLGGANSELIASTLYLYSQVSTNFTVIGQLAQQMAPLSTTKSNNINSALDVFGSISDSTRRAIDLGIAHLVKAASILAAQAANSGNLTALEPVDIDSNCAAGCTSCTNAGMSNTDITTFSNEVSSAAAFFSTTTASDLQVLSNSLRNGVSGGSAGANRCFIYSKLIPAT